MTWSPRNRTAEDDDDDDENLGDAEEDEDDEDLLDSSNTNGRNEQRAERPSSSISVLSDDSRRISLNHHFPLNANEHYSQQLLQSMVNHQAMFSAATAADLNEEQEPKSNKNENRKISELHQRKKIWSIADTLNQARRYKTSASCSPLNSADEFKVFINNKINN